MLMFVAVEEWKVDSNETYDESNFSGYLLRRREAKFHLRRGARVCLTCSRIKCRLVAVLSQRRCDTKFMT